MKKLIVGENDLVTMAPDVVSQWNYSRNTLSPNELTKGSSKKIWWRCSNGHEWQATINNRVNQKQGCPYCANKKAWEGFNDLGTTNPELLEEWNYDKNHFIQPSDITRGSSKKVWWKCSKGHEWQATINNRANQKQGCPYCANQKVLREFNDLETTNPELLKEWDFEKNHDILPTDLSGGSNKKIWWRCPVCGKGWLASPHDRTSKSSGCPACYKRNQTSFPEQAICYYLRENEIIYINGFKTSFLFRMELDIFIPEKNVAIEYDGRAWHSSSKALKRELKKYELCKKNSIFLIRIQEFKEKEKTSDYCILSEYPDKGDKDLDRVIQELSLILHLDIKPDTKRDRKAILENYLTVIKQNSLLKKNPDVASEWNYSKNGMLKPDMFLSGSKEKVWWHCKKGHEWQATIDNRVKGTGCPFCSGRYPIIGETDLQTINPVLAKEWDYSKNGDLTPSNVTSNANKKVWWKCSKGHSWEAMVYARNQGNGCPFCNGTSEVLKGASLEEMYPEVAKTWSEKNGSLMPSMVRAGSNRKVWWKCSKGHEWEAIIYDRTAKNTGCPYCLGKKVIVGFNDLATLNPLLAGEWDVEKNVIKPTEVPPNSHRKVWWKCQKGHSWQALIYNRNKGTSCPYCKKGQYVSKR